MYSRLSAMDHLIGRPVPCEQSTEVGVIEMIDGAVLVLVVATAAACGLMAGAFYAFSSFVMQGLERLPAEGGIAAMQSINVTAVTPPFTLGLFGTAAGCVAVAIVAVTDFDHPAAVYLLSGSILYLVGVVVLTASYHVPRNNALAVVAPASADGAAYWRTHLSQWTRWNHVRALTASAAVALILGTRIG